MEKGENEETGIGLPFPGQLLNEATYVFIHQ